MRWYVRSITRQRLAGRWTRFELVVAAIVTCIGLPYLATVLFIVGVDARYLFESEITQATLLNTRVSRGAESIEVRYRFTASDGKVYEGHGTTPASRHLARDPVAIEYARSDPGVNRPSYPERMVDELLPLVTTSLFVAFIFGISLIPWIGAYWRTRLDRRLARIGVRVPALIASITPIRFAGDLDVIHYEYRDSAGVEHRAEAYEESSRIRLRPGDRAAALVDPERPERAMLVGD
jgi:hypothetical protein